MKPRRRQFDESVEEQLARLRPRVVVGDLREVTLERVRRELRSLRWDRRLGGVAAVLLAVGVGMNFATVRSRLRLPADGHLAAHPTSVSIADLAVSMAEVSDIKTASLVARHLAALKGFPPGSPQADAIGHEINRRLSASVSNGKRG